MTERAVGKLQGLVSIILDEGNPVSGLRPEILELLALLAAKSGMGAARREDLVTGEVRTNQGLAVSPTMAAMCVEDYARTVVFLRGVYQAIKVAEAKTPSLPVRVLYVGCGPYGTLAVPLMALLSSQCCQFVFLDISQEALSSAQALVTRLGCEDSVVDFVEGDALCYEVSRSWLPDVVVSETMQACLRAESQVAIFRHFFSQVPEAIFVPEEVRVELKLVDTGREFSLVASPLDRDRLEVGTAFVLNRDSLSRWEPGELSVLPGETLTVPSGEVGNRQALLFTRIRTFGELVLSDYDSGLTCPRTLTLAGGRIEAGAVLQFRYLLGEDPELHCEVMAGVKSQENEPSVPDYPRG